MKQISEMSWTEFKATTTEEKAKLISDFLYLNDDEPNYVKASEVRSLLQLFDAAEKTRVHLDSTTVFAIQGAILEYYKNIETFPKIVVCRDGSIWVGDCDYCLVVDEYGVDFPSYYIPTDNTVEISLATISFIIERLPVIAFARC